MRLLLVRHGESRWNVEHRYQGQADSGLTALGMRQAERGAATVVERYGPIDAILASDLPRAYDTARPLGRLLGCAIRADRRLRELDVGRWAGRPVAEVAREHPREYAAIRAGVDSRYGGGETYSEMCARVCGALVDPGGLLRDTCGEQTDPDNATIAVFTHGGPIRAVTANTLGIAVAEMQALAHPANVAVAEFASDAVGGRLRMVAYNVPLDNPTVNVGGYPARSSETAGRP